ncbi:DUF262 domain-containing protein [Mariprofundus ferrooxydans]|nr:DUF262 domain-containing protein [Mariprofundus ferrooxydans]
MKRIDGEVFIREKEKINTVKMSDEEINAKYKRGEIRIVTEQARYPVKSIKPMLDGGDYKLNPEYQRRKRWDKGRKSRLIESFIMNVPLPPVFLYEYEYSKFEVMDGLQRLTTIYDYYSGNFALEGLGYWKELEGKTYNELPGEIQKGIDRRYISSIVLLEETAKTPEEAEALKQIVFERLNSGGEKLTPQETRNALYNGEFNKLCLRLSTNEKFRKMWGIPLESEGEEQLLTSEAYRKMDDVQLVLRFFAYRFIDILTGTVEDFLDDYLKQANNFPEKTLIEMEKLFVDTVDTVHGIFGEDAFLSPVYERKITKPQKNIYDPLMQSIAKHVGYKDVLLKNAKDIKSNKYKNETIVQGEKIFFGRNTTPSVVEMRIEYFDALLKPYLK